MESQSGSPAEVRGRSLPQHFYDCLSNIFIERTRNIANTGYLHTDGAKPQTCPKNKKQTAHLRLQQPFKGPARTKNGSFFLQH